MSIYILKNTKKGNNQKLNLIIYQELDYTDDENFTLELNLADSLSNDIKEKATLNYAKGKEITGLKADGQNDSFHYIFHSGTAMKDGKYLSNGGRVLGFVCLGDDVKDAQDKVYANIDKVSFENSFYRHDIGGKR